MRIIFCFIFLNQFLLNIQAQDTLLSLPIKHSSYVNRLVFSFDRRYVYTASEDLTIKLWYYSSGNILKTFSGHTGNIVDIAVNTSNSLLFSADIKGNLLIWDVASGQIVHRLNTQVPIECIHWFEAKKEISVSTVDGKITWISYPEMNVKKFISTAPYIAVKILKAKEPDMYYFAFRKCKNCNNAVMQRGNVQMYDNLSNTFFPLGNYTDDLNNMILSPDSSKLVTSSAENYMVRVWDTGKLIEEATIKNPVKPYTIFVSRTNKMIGVGSMENGELHVYRNSGDEILNTVIDTGKIIYGEINYDITRFHLLNDYGQFKKYDFDFNLKEVMGRYATIHDIVTSVSYSDENKFIAMGLKNGKTKLFDLLNMQITPLPDSFYTPVKQVSVSKNIIVTLYEPYYIYNENGTSSFKSKLVVFDKVKNKILQSFEFADRYITSFFLYSNELILGFNDGKIEFWDYEIHNKNDEYQALPYDILKLNFDEASKKLMIKSVDNQIYILNRKGNGVLGLINTILLDEKDDVISFYSENYSTKTKICFKSTCYEYPVLNICFINNEQCIFKSIDSLYAIKLNNMLWSKPNSIFHTEFILSDSLINKTFLIDVHGNICMLNSKNGQVICIVYFNSDNSWICNSNEFYDICLQNEQRVHAVKGITFVESNMIKTKRNHGLFQKLLIE